MQLRARHPDLNRNLHRIQSLDPTVDFEQIYQIDALYEFGPALMMGLSFAFYRTFAIPRIADLLDHTQELAKNPLKRSFDTGLVIYELISAGLGSSRGRAMIRLMNGLHRRWPIEQNDYTYVLTTFIVIPMRWLERTSWRKPTRAEKEACNAFYVELGRQMNIHHLPATYQDACDFLDQYETEHMAYSRAGANLTAATLPVLATQLPGPLKNHAAAVMSALINEPTLSEAIGLSHPSKAFRALLRIQYTVDNIKLRCSAPRAEPSFTPGGPVELVYPNGYSINQLGPSTS